MYSANMEFLVADDGKLRSNECVKGLKDELVENYL